MGGSKPQPKTTWEAASRGQLGAAGVSGGRGLPLPPVAAPKPLTGRHRPLPAMGSLFLCSRCFALTESHPVLSGVWLLPVPQAGPAAACVEGPRGSDR